MPDTQPKPAAAAEVLATHVGCRWNGLTTPGVGMTCGAPLPAAGTDITSAHQAEMLAAEGYPTTAEALAEHDARVLRDAADAWEDLVQRECPPVRGSVWLRARATRITVGA